ncbi:Putative NIF/NLI interacting factor [Lymphocystis disease virus 1]|uniref:Putative NIF/NLI interacting factor n=1 Tax=Fish lymphocystis disease virus TaxID=36363 RepID=UPI0000161EDA|nr:Putative NIF/NLI interacting factor [Lymphocystis disease virus 1]
MLNIFLDLDETLIHSFHQSKLGVVDLTQGTYCKGTVPPFTKNRYLAVIISKYEWSVIDNYIVCHRPYLDMFLQIIATRYNINVWTAASAFYATQVVENLNILNLGLLLYNKHCPKDLRKLKNLGYSLQNTYIIDDLDEVKNLQYNNCIQIKPFTAASSQVDDCELLQIIAQLIELE